MPSAMKATIKYYSQNRVLFTGSASMLDDRDTLYSNHLTENMLPLHITDDETDLQHLYICLTNGTVNVVSDGSYLKASHTGAAGWVIETVDERVHLEGLFGTT